MVTRTQPCNTTRRIQMLNGKQWETLNVNNISLLSSDIVAEAETQQLELKSLLVLQNFTTARKSGTMF